MKVEVKLDPAAMEPEVTIRTAEMTEEVTALIRRLTAEFPSALVGYQDGKAFLLDPGDLLRIYAESSKVFAETDKAVYVLRQRLYELEERLDPRQFVRISSGEIINLRKVVAFDLSLTGTICVSLQGGHISYVSRRHVSGIKKVLGL